jgi:hypothetical protein
MTSKGIRAVLVPWMRSLTFVWLACNLAACHQDSAAIEGVDPSKVPEDVRSDYVLFTQRCSKCHSLARPLQSGITNDDYWAAYVERMRRQPGSGIAPEETPRILRFLHYYSTTVRLRNVEPAVEASPAPVEDGGGAL